MKLRFHLLFFSVFIALFIIELLIAIFLKSGFIRHTFGDFLVVIMLFYGIKSITTFKTLPIAITVLSIAFTIEILQLFNVLTILGLQDNHLAVLVLGSHFSYQDLLAYTLGIATALLIDNKILRK
ncbi:DUF2809 domain-containing protein [Bizionia paragorgiae]|jgi:hypothetical protein|uniref:ribosomal maturation YjgA family protein n=1 Tax=Bizionia paragorgiae TaxID=283786 RepID=UPI00299EAA07|nr:DUF2809 domain-containing protein [Bizionia paragorgiae]MDX1271545.1 DUF2809 domain-containing protein [Bizionia paragorgiae]